MRTVSYYVNVANEIVHGVGLRLRQPEMYRMISRVKEGKALFASPYKYLHLAKLLRTFRPKSILECGSGASTAVFAEYAENSGAFLCSLESSEQWRDNTANALGSRRTQVNFVLASAKTEMGDPIRYYYEFDPRSVRDGQFDLVYIDGPPLQVDTRKVKNYVNWNIVDMINGGLGPKVIVIDGRVDTVNYVAQNFSSIYKLYRQEYRRLILAYRFHSYFVRRETPSSTP